MASKHTAENILNKDIPTVVPTVTAKGIMELLRTENFESINYVYVLNSESKLVGVISVRELFKKNPDTTAQEIMKDVTVFSYQNEDQEEVAYKALRNNLKAIPVVTKDMVFLGAVVSDIILKIIDHEAIENTLRQGGLYVGKEPSHEQISQGSLRTSVLHRLPWLVVGLLGGLFSATVIKNFESTISENLILASFLPLIVYMSDAAKTQIEAFIIRDLSYNKEFNFVHYFFKQLIIIFILATILSIFLFLISIVTHKQYEISIVLGISLITAISSSVLTGLLIPFLFWKAKLDPADASGPIGTVIQDFISISIYLTLASAFLT